MYICQPIRTIRQLVTDIEYKDITETWLKFLKR